jgi:hypothetical protein
MDLTSPALLFFVTHRETDEAVSDAANAVPSRPRPVSVV